MKKQPILITNAARSQEVQFRSRQFRYVSMMLGRTACLILGAILISVQPPLWLILCAAGMVFLPWAAVLIANDRPPKSKAERAASELAYKQQAALAQQPTPEMDYMIIDVDPVDDRPKS